MTTAPNYAAGELLPGTKYAVVQKLGEGAMGVVFEVVKPPDIRGVAKLMSSSLLRNAGFRDKFLAEARILAQLDHPNIVRVFDYDVLSDGRPFFVMELLKGTSLERVVGNKTLPPRVVYRIMQQLLSALECAHTHETPIVHRDVKPANIFLHKPRHGGSVVKLLDFGVMTPADKKTIMAGTPGYASPEQLRSERVSARTDVYAAAVVLYEMLVGHGPFPIQETLGGEALLRATLEAPPERITRYAKWVPESIADALASALDKDPAKRPPSAEQFLAMLAELDRADLFGDAAELSWPGAPTPPPAMVTSLTAVVRSSLEASTPPPDPGAAAAPRAVDPGRLAAAGPKRIDTFASHHSDANRGERHRRVTRWLVLAGAVGALAGVAGALAWPFRTEPVGLTASDGVSRAPAAGLDHRGEPPTPVQPSVEPPSNVEPAPAAAAAAGPVAASTAAAATARVSPTSSIQTDFDETADPPTASAASSAAPAGSAVPSTAPATHPSSPVAARAATPPPAAAPKPAVRAAPSARPPKSGPTFELTVGD